MELFQVWMEGFVCNEYIAKPELLGTYRTNSFIEACRFAIADHDLWDDYDEHNNTVYGCRLFDNEVDSMEFD